MDAPQVAQLRQQLRVSATGNNIAAPVASFAHLSHVLGGELMEGIRRHGYQQPTPIQAQAIPVALAGRDVIGVAETGSGKTVAPSNHPGTRGSRFFGGRTAPASQRVAGSQVLLSALSALWVGSVGCALPPLFSASAIRLRWSRILGSYFTPRRIAAGWERLS